jgi:hypothetical protein
MAKSTMGDGTRHGGKSQLHVTAGSILTPVIGFRGAGITGTPPKPEARGYTNEPGDGPIPTGKTKTTGATRAMGAFGLGNSGKD